MSGDVPTTGGVVYAVKSKVPPIRAMTPDCPDKPTPPTLTNNSGQEEISKLAKDTQKTGQRRDSSNRASSSILSAALNGEKPPVLSGAAVFVPNLKIEVPTNTSNEQDEVTIKDELQQPQLQPQGQQTLDVNVKIENDNDVHSNKAKASDSSRKLSQNEMNESIPISSIEKTSQNEPESVRKKQRDTKITKKEGLLPSREDDGFHCPRIKKGVVCGSIMKEIMKNGKPLLRCTNSMCSTTRSFPEPKPPKLTPVDKSIKTTRPRTSFKCKDCPKTFPNQTTLDAHAVNHSDELYPCNYCEKRFRYVQSVKVHTQYHLNGFEPLVCDKCEKQFVLKSSWTVHVKACHAAAAPIGKPPRLHFEAETDVKPKQKSSTKSKDISPQTGGSGRRASYKPPQTGGRKSSYQPVTPPEQSGLPIKKRGRPPKAVAIQQPPLALSNEEEEKPFKGNNSKMSIASVTEVIKKEQLASVPNLKKSSERNTASPASSTSLESLPMLINEAYESTPERGSPNSDVLPTRSQRKRNPPKWTENMVMDYDLSYATAVPRPSIIRGPSVSSVSRKSSVEVNQSVIMADMAKAFESAQKRSEKEIATKGAAASSKENSLDQQTVDEVETQEAVAQKQNNVEDSSIKAGQKVSNSNSKESPLPASILAESSKETPEVRPTDNSQNEAKEKDLSQPQQQQENEIQIVSEVICKTPPKTVIVTDHKRTSSPIKIEREKSDTANEDESPGIAKEQEKPAIENTPASSQETKKTRVNSKSSNKGEEVVEKDKPESEVVTRSRITRRQFITGGKKIDEEVKEKSAKPLAAVEELQPTPEPEPQKKNKGGRKRKVKRGMPPKRNTMANKSVTEEAISEDETMKDEEETSPIQTRNSQNSSPSPNKRNDASPPAVAPNLSKCTSGGAEDKNTTDYSLKVSLERLEEPPAKRTRHAAEQDVTPPRVRSQRRRDFSKEVTPPPVPGPTPPVSTADAAEIMENNVPSASTNGFGPDPDPNPLHSTEALSGAHFAGMPKLLVQNRVPPVEFVGDYENSSSESEGEIELVEFRPPPSRRSSVEPYIKDEVIRFVGTKISNRNMLRIRQELMQLKQSGNYFKLTKTAPLAAGLVHEMFCQNLDPSPSPSCSSGDF